MAAAGSAVAGLRTPAGRWGALAAFAGTLALAALLTHDRVFWAGNDASRFAHIQALGEHGRSAIDGTRYAWTPDRVELRGRSYSNKPPLLAMLGAGLYRALRGPLDLSFERREAETVWILTFLLVGLPTAVLASLFSLALGLHRDVGPGTRVLGVLALATGTLLTSFVGTLNGHNAAAALLFGALFAALRGRPRSAGLCAGLAACIDIVPGLFFLPAIASLVSERAGPGGLRGSLQMLGLTAVIFLAANWLTVGHPLPPKLVPGGVDLSSRHAPSIAGVVLPSSAGYALAVLLGWHGFLSVSPVLLFGVAGLLMGARRGVLVQGRSAWLLVGAVAGTALFHALFAGAFGGWSYGFRYLIPLIPVLLLFAPVALRSAASRAAFVPVLGTSMLLALLGAYHPWPPSDEGDPTAPAGATAALVSNPVGGNLAAWVQEHWPESPLAARLGARFIDPEPSRRFDYLSLFFGSKGDVELQRAMRLRSAR